MLSEEYHELLSSYVDGELSTRQRKSVLRLLRKSSEARSVLRQMQETARQLRLLPRHPSNPELELRILQAFADRQPPPTPFRPAATLAPSMPLWLGAAAAAAILLAFTVGSYIYFTHGWGPGRSSAPTAQREPPSPPVKPANSEGPQLPAVLPRPAPEAFVGPPAPEKTAPEGPELVRVPRAPPVDEPGRDPEILAAPSPVEKKELFRAEDVKLPVLIKLHELDEQKNLERLRAEFQKASSFRLELPCRGSSGQAFRRMQTVLEAAGVGLVIDSVAQVRLNYAQVKTNYVIYLEDVTPDELARLLQQLGAEDSKADAKRREFTQLVTLPMNDADRKELSQLLGVDPRQLQPPKMTAPLGVDLRKPFSETTGAQVAMYLAGQGGVPRPEPGKPVVKPPQRSALALAYNPVRPRPNSPEVKRFLDARKQPREGTLQVLLVLRDVM